MAAETATGERDGGDAANGIRGLDHVLVGVAELEAAKSAWGRLGFKACPRGRHIGWGTANYCLMFPHDYVELIGIVDAGQFVNRLDEFLAARGEGLMAVAFATDDAADCAERLRAEGIAAEGPKDLKRILELPEGEALPEFKLVFTPDEATPALRSFVCHHLTPEIVWRPEWLEHPNGAQAITEVVVAVELPGELGLAYATLLGMESVRAADGWIQVQAGDCILTFLGPETLAKRYPDVPAGPVPRIAGMTVAVRDPAATRYFLEVAEVPFAETEDGRLRIAPEQATGVALEFVQA
jgi:catechol 2,3-dioxygenase-like lactoylglutathione lyase family enzyme